MRQDIKPQRNVSQLAEMVAFNRPHPPHIARWRGFIR